MSLGPIQLLKKRTFLPLFLTQFFGAFNDNAFKFAMLTLISYHLSSTQTQSEFYQAIASALFIIPFFLFSATAGQLADKLNKAKITQIIKVFELGLMAMGGFALYFGHTWLMLVTLTGMGIHSSFFGPIKYAILPDLLPPPQLLGATALIEASTFLAILLGTVLGSLSIAGIKWGSLYAIVLIGLAATAGLIASLFLLPTKPLATDLKIDWNPWRATLSMVRQISQHEGVMVAIFAISWFWLIGAVMLTKLPDYTNYILRADASVFTVFLALFSIGIALGSMAINYLLAGKTTLRYVPHAMILLSLFAADIYWASPVQANAAPLQPFAEFFKYMVHWRIAIDLFLLAFSGGLFVVPLYTYLQVASNDIMRARTIAANNIINAFFIVIGTCLVMLLLHLQVAIPQVFFILALLNLLVACIFYFVYLQRLGCS